MASSSSTAQFAAASAKQDKSVIAQVQHAVSAIRQHTFALFAAINLSAASSTGPKLFIVSTLVQTLQWLWFPLTSTAGYPWTDTYVSWLRALAKIARFDLYITAEDTKSTPLAVPIVLLACCILLTTAALLICRQLLKIQSNALASSAAHGNDGDVNTTRTFAARSWLLHTLATALNWGTSFLFLPVSALLIGTIRCPKYESSCFEGSHLAAAVIGMFTLALWLPLCVLYVAFKFPRAIRIQSMADSQVSSNGAISAATSTARQATSVALVDYKDSAHTRVALLHLVSAVITVTAFELAVHTDNTSQWGLGMGYLVIVACNLIAQLWYLPLRHRTAQAFDIACRTVLAWSGVCVLIMLAYHNEEQVVASVLLLLGAPLVVALVQFMHARRTERFLQQECTSIQDPLLVEVCLRLHQQYAQDLRVQTSITKQINTDGATDRQTALQDTTALFNQCWSMCKTSPSALFSLQLARECSEQPAGRQRVALLLQLSGLKEPALDVQFGLYCLQQSLDESLQEDMKDLSVQRYMRFRELSASASEQVIVAARCQKAFFTELAAPEPNVEKLTKEGVVGD